MEEGEGEQKDETVMCKMGKGGNLTATLPPMWNIRVGGNCVKVFNLKATFINGFNLSETYYK